LREIVEQGSSCWHQAAVSKAMDQSELELLLELFQDAERFWKLSPADSMRAIQRRLRGIRKVFEKQTLLSLSAWFPGLC
jgi:hypothetical protein